jgi:hypothetical protein
MVFEIVHQGDRSRYDCHSSRIVLTASRVNTRNSLTPRVAVLPRVWLSEKSNTGLITPRTASKVDRTKNSTKSQENQRVETAVSLKSCRGTDIFIRIGS